ncbi:Uncharacterized protein TPAR_07615 [Tolypocladium paradoxum]|uniref:IDI-2 n=1 Tax=Tolypocladium paradoxum TaxID=94208 RepID=A0A2S4KPW5_9HYPO|nr:Uncharacterized protein TPAR_07615 [Tolypocladium paradoxum]
MKGYTNILVVAYAALALGAAMPDNAAECGQLGAMSLALDAGKLPEGATLGDVRKCADHPLGRDRDLATASMPTTGDLSSAPAAADNLPAETTPNDAGNSGLTALEGRACEKAAQFGCSKGYCWKTCGNNGEWCWTARNGGSGSWYTCNSWHECGTEDSYACGKFCSSCGCSC